MLKVTQLHGFNGGAKTPLSVSLQAQATDSNNLTTYSFAGVTFGADSPSRRIIVAFHYSLSDNTTKTFSSATIAGIAATLVGQSQSGPSGAAIIDTGVIMFSAIVPTGASGTVSITVNSSGILRAYIGVWRQIDESIATPNVVTDNTLTGSTLSGALNVGDGGSVIAASTFLATSGAPINYAGATKDYDPGSHAELSTMISSGASIGGLSAEVGRTVSATGTGASTVRGGFVAASWS